MNPFAVPSLSLALQSAPGGQNPLLGLVPMVLIFAIFYALLLLPMRKQRKALQKMIDNLQKGDRIITNGGIHGEVAAVDGPTVLLKIADNVKIRLAKSAIAGLQGEGERAKEEKGEKV
jgi:preprotein translocase subunit YajC